VHSKKRFAGLGKECCAVIRQTPNGPTVVMRVYRVNRIESRTMGQWGQIGNHPRSVTFTYPVNNRGRGPILFGSKYITISRDAEMINDKKKSNVYIGTL